VLTALVTMFLIFVTAVTALMLAPAVEATTALGYPADTALWIGLIELACLGLHLVPAHVGPGCDHVDWILGRRGCVRSCRFVAE
jgi:hypothetical protein